MLREARFYGVLVLAVCWLTLALLSASAQAQTQCGIASFYGWEAGTHTANGERWNPDAMTAAHPSWPFGLYVRVTREDTGASVVVRLNDRGPARWTGRVIDLSHAAAAALGMIRVGIAPVCITVEP